jgi:hypothetical protein
MAWLIFSLVSLNIKHIKSIFSSFGLSPGEALQPYVDISKECSPHLQGVTNRILQSEKSLP